MAWVKLGRDTGVQSCGPYEMRILLLSMPDSFEPPTSVELRGLQLFEGRSYFEGKDVRLGCQACPTRDCTVTRTGVRPT